MCPRSSVCDNIASFDIEGFVESSLDVMSVPERYFSQDGERHQIEKNTDDILEVLAEADCRATFFILGRIARDIPSLVARIARAGHEIACHGLFHRRLYNLEDKEAKESISAAKTYLEDAGGTAVYGFRAPDFSITQENRWMFDALRDAGYVYDSSVYPTDIHDVYGIGGFTETPFRMENGLVEMPMSTVKIGRRIPFGGGGYFRLYPYFITRLFTRMANQNGVPVMLYLHPYEVGEIVPFIREMTPLRRFRTYVGRSTTRRKLARYLRGFRFTRMIDYIRKEWPDHG